MSQQPGVELCQNQYPFSAAFVRYSLSELTFVSIISFVSCFISMVLMSSANIMTYLGAFPFQTSGHPALSMILCRS